MTSLVPVVSKATAVTPPWVARWARTQEEGTPSHQIDTADAFEIAVANPFGSFQRLNNPKQSRSDLSRFAQGGGTVEHHAD